MKQIVFWQRIISPHMFGLAQALEAQGWKVTYIVEEKMSSDRAQIGWGNVDTGSVETIIFRDSDHIDNLAQKYSDNAVHLVQGVNANGVMEDVRRSLKRHGAKKWGAIMETVDERSLNWPLKRLVYRSRLSRWAARHDFILAIGAKTPDWVVARGFPPDRTFPFAYFIPLPPEKPPETTDKNGPFRIGFVGSLIPLKRVDLLIDALAGLDHLKFGLAIVGDGPLHSRLESAAIEKLGQQRIEMPGILPMSEIPSFMRSLDCLVLPSEHDGWGVVISEALMAGVPAICSDACGAAAAVNASGVGGVFAKDDISSLRSLLDAMITKGPADPDQRKRLAGWAKCFGAGAGAEYVDKIITHVYDGGARPVPPWS